ncbi:MAG: ACP S-malonyltransferase [Dehalococcoidia bacterium]
MVERSRVAYVFPGQGSQSVGMGRDLYSSYPSAKKTFDEADACLGFPLSRLCFEGPAEELVKTHNVQPAIVVASLACFQALQEASGNNFSPPAFVAGHSLGEYTALVAAGVLNLTNAVLLVKERGRLMYEAGLANPGGMLALIGFDEQTVRDITLRSGTEISNINCPGQIVISGPIEALAEAAKLAKAKNARAVIPLKVSGAFHSALMEPIVAEFGEIVSNFEFHPPSIPIVSNVTAQALTDVDSIKEDLVKQLRNCVQWQGSVEYMMHNGVTTFYEIGPGKVLTGLIKRINPELQTVNISGVEDIAKLTSKDSPTDYRLSENVVPQR